MEFNYSSFLRFLLVSYDDNYQEYLAALGIPGFVISLILSSRELITIRQPDDPAGNWTMHTKTGFKRSSFVMILSLGSKTYR